MTDDERPLLAVDLYTEPGRTFHGTWSPRWPRSFSPRQLTRPYPQNWALDAQRQGLTPQG
jgi:hypothetical protein